MRAYDDSRGAIARGYEIQFGTNVVELALFTQLLLPILRQTAKINKQTRVVMLSSAAHARAPRDVYKLDEFRTTWSTEGRLNDTPSPSLPTSPMPKLWRKGSSM